MHDNDTPAFDRRAPIRWISAALLAFATAFAAVPALAQNKPEPLRIGFQKYGTLTVLKARGDLEKRLALLGIEVRWIEFPAGPQLLEGLNVGSIDVGTVGEAPPIFAQAAGADIVDLANQPSAPAAETTGIDAKTWSSTFARAEFTFGPVTPPHAAQQQLADAFQSLGIIPRKITVADIIWNAPKP